MLLAGIEGKKAIYVEGRDVKNIAKLIENVQENKKKTQI